jgi:hypothetical protein
LGESRLGHLDFDEMAPPLTVSSLILPRRLMAGTVAVPVAVASDQIHRLGQRADTGRWQFGPNLVKAYK